MLNRLKRWLRAYGDQPYINDGRGIVVLILLFFASALLSYIVTDLVLEGYRMAGGR